MLRFPAFVTVLVVALSAALADAGGLPNRKLVKFVERNADDVGAFGIDSPTNGTVWKVGQKVSVTWCVFDFS